MAEIVHLGLLKIGGHLEIQLYNNTKISTYSQGLKEAEKTDH